MTYDRGVHVICAASQTIFLVLGASGDIPEVANFLPHSLFPSLEFPNCRCIVPISHPSSSTLLLKEQLPLRGINCKGVLG